MNVLYFYNVLPIIFSLKSEETSLWYFKTTMGNLIGWQTSPLHFNELLEMAVFVLLLRQSEKKKN